MLKFIRTQAPPPPTSTPPINRFPLPPKTKPPPPPPPKPKGKPWTEAVKGDGTETTNQKDYKLKLTFDSSCQLEVVRLNGSHFKSLTHLNLSENNICRLDLQALDNLEWLQCSRNRLQELLFNGKNIKSVIADNNNLKSVSSVPPASLLALLDLSHNSLSSVPESLLKSASGTLQTLRLGHNQLSSFPSISLPSITELCLPANKVTRIPNEVTAHSNSLRILQVTNNALSALPLPSIGNPASLEELYASANRLESSELSTLVSCRHLKVLHIAHNRITTLDSIWIASWPILEELVVSDNDVDGLPEAITSLKYLRILRVHKNKLEDVPSSLSTVTSLRVLDLSTNRLSQLNMSSVIGPHLQVLDLSCNSPSPFDPKTLQPVWGQCRPVSLVSVSQQRSTSSDTTYCNGTSSSDGYTEIAKKDTNKRSATAIKFSLGFSETPSVQDNCLYVSQLRLLGVGGMEALVGLVDGGQDTRFPKQLARVLPRVLQEEQTIAEEEADMRNYNSRDGDYVKFAILSACKHLNDQGYSGVPSAFLCHISPLDSVIYKGSSSLKAAFMGSIQAVIARKGKPLQVIGELKKNCTDDENDDMADKNGESEDKCDDPMLPDPKTINMLLEAGDEIILANQSFWNYLSPEEALLESRGVTDPTFAAKRLQNLAQGYGCKENISIIILRAYSVIKRSTQQKKQPNGTASKLVEASNTETAWNGLSKGWNATESEGDSSTSDSTQGSLRGVTRKLLKGDRSSPSGQSDGASGDSSACNDKVTKLQRENRYRRSERRSSHHHISHLPVLEESTPPVYRTSLNVVDNFTSLSEGSTVDEERFKCWEYILEENAHKLFHRELDTLSRGIFKRNAKARMSLGHVPVTPAVVAKLNKGTEEDDYIASKFGPFLSRYFGSARSFLSSSKGSTVEVTSTNQTPNLSNRSIGGPNAAYFGSLQRLMPQGVEYNFERTRECRNQHDSLEHESRLQRYWDGGVKEVKTTEL